MQEVHRETSQGTEAWNPDRILGEVRSLLHDLIVDYDPDFAGGIGPQTWLSADLMLDSLTLVAMIVELEGRFRRKGLPFDEILLLDGSYVDDIQVAQLVAFLHRHLTAPRSVLP